MSSAANSLQDFLTRLRPRLNCFAVAFLSTERQLFLFDCQEHEQADYIKQLIRRSGDSFLEMCRDQNGPVVRNRVRDGQAHSADDQAADAHDGQHVCRFLIAPLFDQSDNVAGAFVMCNLPSAPEFVDADVATATRVVRTLSKSISAPRDPLTKLLTREGFEHRVHRYLEANPECDPPLLLYGNIDQLHVINDVWGFPAGDRAIALVAKQLRATAATMSGAVCRISGDRFAVFLPRGTLDSSREHVDKLNKAIVALRFTCGGQMVPLTLSWGAALLRTEDRNVSHGLAAAESACRGAKENNHSRMAVYVENEETAIRRRGDLTMMEQLRDAMAEERFEVYGQPVMSLQHGEDTRRYEMLVRLLDQDDNLVMPRDFMSQATRLRMLAQLDRHVIAFVLQRLRTAVTQQGFKPLQVSFNLSGSTVSAPDFSDWLYNLVSKSGVPGDWVWFELSETAAVENLQSVQALIARMAVLGCKFALDDFGTGVNSLAYLKALKLSMIKIDGSFVRDLLENERSEALVRGIAQLAKSLGIETVAEYVESPSICMKLIDLGVHFGQGYALGKPVALDRILDPLRSLALAS